MNAPPGWYLLAVAVFAAFTLSFCIWLVRHRAAARRRPPVVRLGYNDRSGTGLLWIVLGLVLSVIPLALLLLGLLLRGNR